MASFVISHEDRKRSASSVLVTSAILALFSRNYWKRLWIIQEILLAQDLVVCCGQKQIHWGSFESFWNELVCISSEDSVERYPYIDQVEPSNAMALVVQRIDDHNQYTFHNRRRQLDELLEIHWDAQCTDIRDKVFGLLGLISTEGKHSPFIADYSMSVEEVYSYTLRYLYESTESPHLKGLSRLRIYARILQKTLNLGYSDALVEAEINKIIAPQTE
ncbi:MAG: hypothetical protein M1839_005292 [Geoglossum umbratile]|nr:MAG: hypothetical protein M1839_005292 [Geoglossum umbratile]